MDVNIIDLKSFQTNYEDGLHVKSLKDTFKCQELEEEHADNLPRVEDEMKNVQTSW